MRGGERGFEHEPQGTVICVSFLPPFKVIGVGDVFRRSESGAEERVNVLGLIKGLGWGGEEEEEEEERGGGGVQDLPWDPGAVWGPRMGPCPRSINRLRTWMADEVTGPGCVSI